MKKLLIFLNITLFCAAAYGQGKDSFEVNYSNPIKLEIGGIAVQSVDFPDKRYVIAASGLSVSQKVSIPGDEITQAIQNLWKKGLFSDVKISIDRVTGSKVFLNIYVKSNPKLSRFTFVGITKGKANKLRDEIKLKTEEVVTPQLIESTRFKIKDYYTEKGFPNAKVIIMEEPDTGFEKNSVLFKIQIDAGSRVRIHKITFIGNTVFTNTRLKRVLSKTKEYQMINVFRSSRLNHEDFAEDSEKVAEFYHNKGYKDAKIISDSIYGAPGKTNMLDININMYEGHKYVYRSVTWAGNTKYDSKALNAILAIKKGDTYNPELLEKHLFINNAGLDVTSLYMDDGYLFFSLTPVETHVENDSVDLEIRIFEGPQATINNVTITGNTKTHDAVILRELRVKPGQKFSRSDIIRSQRELSQLGYFDPEKMNVIPTPNAKDGTVDIEFQVVEKPSDQIELSGGWGANQLVGVLGLTLNNFSIQNLFDPSKWQGYPSGDGERLTLRAQTSGAAYQSYNISFTEPWFGGKRPNSFTVSTSYSIYTNGLASSNPSYYRLTAISGSVALGKRLKWPDDFFTFSNSINYQYFTFQNYPLISNFTTGYANNFYFQHILSRNGLIIGDPIYPKQGSNLTFTLQWTPPYSLIEHRNINDLSNQEKYKWIEYNKEKFDASYYLGMGPQHKLVLMSQANFGFMGLYNPALGYSPFQRFFLGGDGLSGYSIDGRELIRLRGYKTYSAVTPTLTNSAGTVIENGAIIYNRFTFELRYPIIASQAATIYVLGFAEGGNAFMRWYDYDPFALYRSAGFGVRLYLPMFGLLGFDWGYGFDPTPLAPGQGGGNFMIYIGQPLY